VEGIMTTDRPKTKQCQHHAWERQLEVHRGVECVVRVCPRCGRKELCWSRQPMPPDEINEPESWN
jgi:hypothetical protein